MKNCMRMFKQVHMHQLQNQVPKFDVNSLRIVVFSDASFESTSDLTSQLGYICFLSDATEADIPIFFKSYKERRVTRSVVAAEVICFSEMFYCCFYLGRGSTEYHAGRIFSSTVIHGKEVAFRCDIQGYEDRGEEAHVGHCGSKKVFRKRKSVALVSSEAMIILLMD